MLDNKSRLPVAIKDVIIVVAGVAIVWSIVWIWFGTNPFYVVSSGSMEPVLKQYDILVVRDGESFNDLKVGEIIVFHRPEGGDRVIVHRIVEILEGRDGDRILRTKGDANPSSIPGTDFPIEQQDYIGRVVYVIPGVGFITQAIAPPVNYIIIAIILAILFFNRMGRKSKPNASAATTTTTANSSQDPLGAEKLGDPTGEGSTGQQQTPATGTEGQDPANAGDNKPANSPESQPQPPQDPNNSRNRNEVQD